MLQDAEYPWTEDDEEDRDDEDDNTISPLTFGKRHKQEDERERIVYEQELQEAKHRSLEDRGHKYGHGRSYVQLKPA